MGTYNADPVPDIPRAQVIARNYNFLSDDAVLTDQWTINPTDRVSSFNDGTGNIKVKFKYDPTSIDLTP